MAKRRHTPLRTSGQDIDTARQVPRTPQTESAAYRLAFSDEEFMTSEETRGIRFQLEYLKVEQRMREAGINSTIVLFGGARIPEPGKAAWAARNETQRKNLEAVQQKLELKREEEYSTMAQEREVEVRRAQQQSEIARERAEKRQAAEQAEIAAQQQVDQSKIVSDRAVAEQRIAMEQQLKQREVEKVKGIELSEQDRAIAVAERSKAQSEAQAAADVARAESVRAAEQVDTVREVERAERQKRIELVEAAKEAEREMIGSTTAAQAEKRAAEDRAEAIRTLNASGAPILALDVPSGLDADSGRVWNVAVRSNATITFVGLTALSVETITNLSAPYSTALSATILVPLTLVCTAS